MRAALYRNRYLLGLFTAFLLAEIFADPQGEFPLNDDWSYAYTVIMFEETGDLQFGLFPAMTLCTHVLWGWLFTKIAGFSLFALRLSTLLASLIGLTVLYKLVTRIAKDERIALLACLVLLFNPIYFCLSNTFMTDVSFSTLAILCVLFIHNYLRTQSLLSYAGFVLASIALVLVRQYGIIFPAAFAVAAFFIQEKKAGSIALSLFAFFAVAFSLRQYEGYLQDILPQGSMYKFSGNIDFLDPDLRKRIWESFSLRHQDIARHMFIYTGALAMIFIPAIVRTSSVLKLIVCGGLSLSAAIYLFNDEHLHWGNIFVNLMVGPETFYESSLGARHNMYPDVEQGLFLVKFFFTLLSLFVFFAGLPHLSKCIVRKRPDTFLLFLLVLLLAYIFLILITESYFDRYHLPVIIIGSLILAYGGRRFRPDFRMAVLPLLLWTWLSVAGTKDYLEWNRQRWRAYRHLREDLNVAREKINGGFELTCWNEGEHAGWRDVQNLAAFDYLIQFRQEEGFSVYREYTFQRYLPYRKDTIRLQKKKSPESLSPEVK